MGKTPVELVKELEQKITDIVEAAGRKAVLGLKHLHKAQEKELLDLKEKTQRLADELIERSKTEAAAEAKAVEEQNLSQVKELSSKALPKVGLAKKEILKCL